MCQVAFLLKLLFSLAILPAPFSLMLFTFEAFYQQEAENNKGGRASHAAWRNYDDFNEYFWYSFLLSRCLATFKHKKVFFSIPYGSTFLTGSWLPHWLM
jgi:1,3-beta-glucan synthase subunit FKS1, domain-1